MTCAMALAWELIIHKIVENDKLIMAMDEDIYHYEVLPEQTEPRHLYANAYQHG